jgi:hypothetical protein
MSQTRHSEASFETVVEAHLLANGYVTVSRDAPTQQQSALSPCFKEHRTALIAAAMTGRNTIHESREDNLQGGRHERRQRATMAGECGTVSR